MDEALPAKRCPICQRPAEKRFHPFCSRRCADVDLHRWLTGGYTLSGPIDPDEMEAEDGGDAPPRERTR